MLPRLWAQFQVPFIIETIHGEDVAIGTWIGRASKHHAEVCMVHCAFVKRVHRQVVVDHVACLHGLFRRLRRFRRPRLLRRCPALLCRLFKRIRCLRLLRHLRLLRCYNHLLIDALFLCFWCLIRRSHLITEACLRRRVHLPHLDEAVHSRCCSKRGCCHCPASGCATHGHPVHLHGWRPGAGASIKQISAARLSARSSLVGTDKDIMTPKTLTSQTSAATHSGTHFTMPHMSTLKNPPTAGIPNHHENIHHTHEASRHYTTTT